MPLPDAWVMAANYDWSTKNYLAPNGPLGIRKDINESSDLTLLKTLYKLFVYEYLSKTVRQ